MQVHSDVDHLPVFKNAVVTIGTFDGVHTGHLQIISQLKKEAEDSDGESVIITFHPHPRKVIYEQHKNAAGNQKGDVQLLNTLSEKIQLLQAQNVDHLVIIPFTEQFAEQSAEDYISKFLVHYFHPHIIITGYDHRFGKNRTGDYRLLEKYEPQYGYKIKEIPGHVLNNVAISSTKIREALIAGDADKANKFLGYRYFFEGEVVKGNRLGRTIGYPTANIIPESIEKLVPANGVYAVDTFIGTKKFKGMMNIGVRPTVGGSQKIIEVNIFDFDDDIYGNKIKVALKKYLRSEKKFDGLDALKHQLAIDKINAECV